MEKVNIKRLADELRLAPSTISRALQDSYQISAATKARVRALAEQLHYVPNAHASSLGSRRSHTLAVVIPEVFDSYFAQAISGIEAVAQASGYHVLIYLTHEQLAREQLIFKDFQGGRVDGVLLSVAAETGPHTAHIEALRRHGVPIVFFDRASGEVAAARVITNDEQSAYLATRHLLACQCRHVALLSISRHLTISQQRSRGYQRALQAHGLPAPPAYLVDCAFDDEANGRLIRETLQAHPAIDGLLLTAEKLAVSAYQACQELGRRIPADVKIVGFSNSRSAAFLQPPLTTITQPAFETGRQAAILLCNALKNNHKPALAEQVVLPSVLHIRASTSG